MFDSFALNRIWTDAVLQPIGSCIEAYQTSAWIAKVKQTYSCNWYKTQGAAVADGKCSGFAVNEVWTNFDLMTGLDKVKKKKKNTGGNLSVWIRQGKRLCHPYSHGIRVIKRHITQKKKRLMKVNMKEIRLPLGVSAVRGFFTSVLDATWGRMLSRVLHLTHDGISKRIPNKHGLCWQSFNQCYY